MAWELADNIRGPKGDKGAAGTISSVSVATLPPTDPATADLTGTTDVHVHFGIPKGDKGDQGVPGTLSSASAESVPAGEQAEVVMSGTTEVKHAHFKVPRGLPGVNAVENDTAVAAYIGATDSATAAALSTTIGEGVRARQAVSVLDHGAVGDGIADDTDAILAAIAQAAGGPVSLMPFAVHKITATIPFGHIVGNGAELLVAADVDALTVTPQSSGGGFTVRVDVTPYNSYGIRIDHDSAFTVAASTTISDITLIGPGSGNGMSTAIGADDGAVERGVVTFLRASVRAWGWHTGLRLRARKTAAPASWMNGNHFQVEFYDMIRYVDFDGIVDGNSVSGNLQIIGATLSAVRCSGNDNEFRTYAWDIIPPEGVFNFTVDGRDGSRNTYTQAVTGVIGNPTNQRIGRSQSVIAPMPHGRVSSVSNSGSTQYALTNMLGDQSDIFRMAHKRYLVTSTIAPATSIPNMFNFGANSTNWVFAGPGSVTVTIDATAAPIGVMERAGVIFANVAGTPDSVKIEKEVGGVVSLVQEWTKPGNPVLITDAEIIVGTIQKIHLTFTVDAAKTIRVNSAFASASDVPQGAFVQTDGGTRMWGDVRFGETGIGPVVVAPNGTAYRLTVNNSGTLGATAIT